MDIWLVCCGCIRRLIIFSLQILDEMHMTYGGGGGVDGWYTDCRLRLRSVRMDKPTRDCLYDPFKQYGWTHQHVTAFTIRTNITDRLNRYDPFA